MGELLYLYLEENNLLDELAKNLVVERNVQLIRKVKSDKEAYFEGSRYFDKKYFREYIDCYNYTYTVNTRFCINNEVVFSYLNTRSGTSIEIEKPYDVYGNENTSMDYFDASGREVVEYQKTNFNDKKEYIMKHVCYNGNCKTKAFRLPSTLKCLLSNENDFASILCRIYNINLQDYQCQLVTRQYMLERIKLIDKEIIRLEKLKNDYLNQLYYGENIKIKK